MTPFLARHPQTPARLGPVARWLPGAILVAAASACGEKSSGPPPVATSIEVVNTPVANSTAGLPVAVAPTFAVKDQNGGTMTGVSVTIAVSAGGGSLATPPTKTVGGGTSIGTWTLGTVVGANTVTVTTSGLAPLTITIQGTAGPPVRVDVVSGGGQVALAGELLASPVVFAAVDQFGNRASSASATFSADQGGILSNLNGAPAADGSVRVNSWRLGKFAGTQTLAATVAGLSGSATATARSDYQISVRFYGPTMTTDRQTLFRNAAARISAFITGDIVNVSVVPALNLADFCQEPGLPTFGGEIDDVIIYATIRPIDGVNNVLARAGPCGVRDESFGLLTAVGTMEFDSADLAALQGEGGLQDVITHEMMHVLGFSAGFWSFNGIITDFDGPSVSFDGSQAIAGCRFHGGTVLCANNVPLENSGGPGTANSHWRESSFATELMTGFFNSGENPISRMTVGSFGDIGYTGLNLAAADDYRVPGTLLRRSTPLARFSPLGSEWEQVHHAPRFTIGRDGTVRRAAP